MRFENPMLTSRARHPKMCICDDGAQARIGNAETVILIIVVGARCNSVSDMRTWTWAWYVLSRGSCSWAVKVLVRACRNMTVTAYTELSLKLKQASSSAPAWCPLLDHEVWS